MPEVIILHVPSLCTRLLCSGDVMLSGPEQRTLITTLFVGHQKLNRPTRPPTLRHEPQKHFGLGVSVRQVLTLQAATDPEGSSLCSRLTTRHKAPSSSNNSHVDPSDLEYHADNI